MFEEDKSKTHFDVKREQIITLLNSTIRPKITMAGKDPESTDAYACTYKEGNNYVTLVFFHLTDSHTGVVYSWDEGPQPRENAKQVEKAALKLADEQGFQMDSLHFRKKSLEEQQKLIDSLPCFKADLSYLRADETESLEMDEVIAIEEGDEDEIDSIDEVMVESIGEEEPAESVEEATEETEIQVEGEELEVGTAEMDNAFEQAFEETTAIEAKPEEVSVEGQIDEFAEDAGVSEVSEEELFVEEDGPAVAEAQVAVEANPEPAQPVAGEAIQEEVVEVAVESDQAIIAEPAQEKPAPPPQPSARVEVPDGTDLQPLARFLASM